MSAPHVQYSAKGWRLGCVNSPWQPEGARTRVHATYSSPFSWVLYSFCFLMIHSPWIIEDSDVRLFLFLCPSIAACLLSRPAAESAWDSGEKRAHFSLPFFMFRRRKHRTVTRKAISSSSSLPLFAGRSLARIFISFSPNGGVVQMERFCVCFVLYIIINSKKLIFHK